MSSPIYGVLYLIFLIDFELLRTIIRQLYIFNFENEIYELSYLTAKDYSKKFNEGFLNSFFLFHLYLEETINEEKNFQFLFIGSLETLKINRK